MARGEPGQRWVVIAHGVGGLLVVLLIRWKTPVIRSGRARSRRSRWLSAALATLTVLALLTGVLHSTGLLTAAAGQLMMWWHVATGLVLLPLLAWHAIGHRQTVRRTDLDRRVLLRSGGLLGSVAGTAWAAVEGLVRVADLPGARRRSTGSYASDLPRPTIWLSDRVPAVDPATWRLAVTTTAGSRTWTLPSCARSPRPTSGPSSTARPAGTPTSSGRARPWPTWSDRCPRGRAWWSVPPRATRDGSAADKLDQVLLRPHHGRGAAAAAAGAPLRLVVPGRRGFWWVKWVDRVEVDDRPAWWQPASPCGRPGPATGPCQAGGHGARERRVRRRSGHAGGDGGRAVGRSPRAPAARVPRQPTAVAPPGQRRRPRPGQHVVAPDLRGYGDSDRPTEHGCYQLDDAESVLRTRRFGRRARRGRPCRTVRRCRRQLRSRQVVGVASGPRQSSGDAEARRIAPGCVITPGTAPLRSIYQVPTSADLVIVDQFEELFTMTTTRRHSVSSCGC